jgi:C1A family cysteine protease
MPRPAAPESRRPARRYGWRPDTPDLRDERYCVPRSAKEVPRALRHLPSLWPEVDDQLDLGCCTGFGTEFAWRVAQGEGAPKGSRLFIYWNERDREGTVREDAGAEIRTGMKVLSKTGVPPEDLWPYRVSRFAAKPPPAAYAAASSRQVLRYARVPQTLDCLKSTLLAERPVVFGFTVYESFESAAVARTGLAPVPGPKERSLGGHCAVAVGWDDDVRCPGAEESGAILVRNSYGRRWGIRPTAAEPHLAGHFWLPYRIILDSNAADDFWAVFQVEGAPA